MADIINMSRKDFEAVPFRKSWDEKVRCDCLVILPLRRLHDSGFRAMDFIAAIKNEPVCRLSGCSDVMHFDGIGGFGYEWLKRFGKVPDEVTPIGWNIDCLPKSGLLRVFAHGYSIVCGASLSSFEFYAVPERDS